MAEPFLNVTSSITGRAWVDRLDEAQTRTTQLTQSWQDGRGGWRMTSEKRSGGDLGLLGDRAKPAPSADGAEIARAPRGPSFQTTIIRTTE